MGKLHEVLAVEGELAGVAKNILEEAKTAFDKKPDLFLGFDKVYEPFDANQAQEAVTEHKEVTESVVEKLEYVFGHLANYDDAVFQKEAANQLAVADIVMPDGVVLAKGVPATMLLGLETKLKARRDVLHAIPTTPPGMRWIADTSQTKRGVFRRHDLEVRFKTNKAVEHKVLVPATVQHPAQVEKWNVDVNVGKYNTTHYCGMLTPAAKSGLLGRIDKLIAAVKQARQRANSVEVPQVKIGETLASYILNG